MDLPVCNKIPDAIPIIQTSVYYIAGCIIFNDAGDQILLVEEAKKRCRGKWYLPLGKIEPNESLAEGALRETLEEAGIDAEILTLASIDYVDCPSWLRFHFLAKWKDGELKTVPDSETLSAQFWPVKALYDDMEGTVDIRTRCDLKLRHTDITEMIVHAHQIYMNCYSSERIDPFPRFHAVLNNPVNHKNISCTAIMLSRDINGDLFLMKKGILITPIETYFDIYNRTNFLKLQKIAMERAIFQNENSIICSLFNNYEILGLYGLEHSGKDGNDGLRLHLVYYWQYQFALPGGSPFRWVPVKNHSIFNKIATGVKLLPRIWRNK